MRHHYLVLCLLMTANGSTFAFMQPVSITRPRRITSLLASDTPEGPESELFDFLKSIIEKPIDWNVNEPGKSPFGFDKNAELWNGRIAQISFVWIFLQEWIQGKGVLQSIIEGDLASNISLEVVCLMLLFVSFQFCMVPFDQNVKIQIPREWLDQPPPPTPVRPQTPKRNTVPTSKSEVRRWNLNEDNKAPYGFDLNAEVWNGRVAMVCFAWVFLQEWIQDKGLLTGLEEKHGPSEAALLLFIIGLSGFITYLHNMFSLEAEAYRRSKLPPPETIETPKIPGPLAGKTFQFGQTNGDIRALNGQQTVAGSVRPSFPPSNVPRQQVASTGWPPNVPPPVSFRQPMSVGALPPVPNAPLGNARHSTSPDGRLLPPTNPPRPNFQPPPPPNSFRSNTQPLIFGQGMIPATPPNTSLRPNVEPRSFGQPMGPGAAPPTNNSFRPNLLPRTFEQPMGPRASPPSNNSIRPNLQPRTFSQPVGPGEVPPSNGYMPVQQQGNVDQGMQAFGSPGLDGHPKNVRPIPGVDALSFAPEAGPFEKSMIQSYEESLRTMTKETPLFSAATSQQQELRYEAPTYPGLPRRTPTASETTASTAGPPRTQLFKSDALSSVAKGDSSFLDQIAPPTFSTRTSTEIVSPETKPGVRPFPKPESFSFSLSTPIAQLGKSSTDQSWTRGGTEQYTEDAMPRALSSPESSNETNGRTASSDPMPYIPETPPPRYQSSPYNMPDPTKRKSYLDQLGPS